ncbi:putative membrane protein [Paraburkholderia xenovorans LB400]|uniref:Membrane protein n=1 Tax=Paraburkholderia xenovorans (strain LB400) TaxID=266265 RepID=Q13FJ3_PARXL|nr:hypothetical protein [Paraburkholderia xenovorans]ABE37146.1 Putative membrane protein [Paraburkholderia xenovorans LB400]AIP34256.1 putative membrane protein [Paraburkholderia xenovorans LB400]
MNPRYLPGLIGAAAGAAALAAIAVNRGRAQTARGSHQGSHSGSDGGSHQPEALQHIAAARSFNRGSALLALSVLADSAMEHYRGSFENPAMYTPLISSTLSLLAGLHGGGDPRSNRHPARHAIYLTAALAGVSGTAFHLYNVTRRPGGWSWNNLFHAAPIGAPMALLLSGALGATAERLRDQPSVDPELFGMPAGRALGLLVAAGLVGTVAEAGLLHFRGSFQNPAMYAPVSLPPIAAALLAQAALGEPRGRWFTRLWLRVTAALGLIGAGFHARGIARHQGGWRNWSQNLFNGPPLPAPPSFSALALAGLAALRLRETEQ